MAFLAVAALLVWLAWAVSWWLLAILAAPLAAWGWVLWFFRDPPRDTPPAGELFLSPADGTLSDITPIGPDGELGRNGVKLGIFMSIFDVHVNRSPADARVRAVEHRSGAFLDARDPSAGERNESATIHMTYERGGMEYPIVVRQVAGLIARRIITDLTEGQTLRRGERIGMIKFGSRVELLLPDELVGEVRVEVGRHVRAGETVLVAGPSGEDP